MLFVMCPGQENQTWSTLRKAPILLESSNPGSSPKRKSFNNYSMIMNQRQTKRQILSLFANDFSCAELQQMIPRLSKWPIDQTWQHVIHTGQGQPIPEQPIFRTKMDAAKVDHLLNFITRPESVTTITKPTVKDVMPWKM